MTIHELMQRSGYSRRTIYYYTQIGLLPPPKGKGKNFQYNEGHLRRLQKIKELQKARLSLREIQQVLEREGAEEALNSVAFNAIESNSTKPREGVGEYGRFLAAETTVRIILAPGLEILVKWPLTRETRDFLQTHLPEILERLEDSP